MTDTDIFLVILVVAFMIWLQEKQEEKRKAKRRKKKRKSVGAGLFGMHIYGDRSGKSWYDRQSDGDKAWLYDHYK